MIQVNQASRRLVVALDHHFIDVQGRFYTELAFGYEFWHEYLDTFSEVCVLARVRRAPDVPTSYFAADGPGVTFFQVPDFRGPYQLVARFPAVMRVVWRAANLEAYYILRCGSVATCLWMALLLKRKPYAREVLGMIGEAIREATRTDYPRLGPVLGRLSEFLTRLQVRWASAASYVSEACRRRYPAATSERETVFSDVQLNEDVVTRPRSAERFSHTPLKLISVGRLELEKGHHVLVDAAAELHERKPGSVSVTLVGGGSQSRALRQRVREAGLDSVVHFVGPVKYGTALFEKLDEADLFVLPSLTEGMPRALIEAMARGLPAIGSRAGGIEELLDDSQVVIPNSASALAAAIAARIGEPDILALESSRNFYLATTQYTQGRMREMRHTFWTSVIGHGQRRMAA